MVRLTRAQAAAPPPRVSAHWIGRNWACYQPEKFVVPFEDLNFGMHALLMMPIKMGIGTMG